MRRQRLVAAGAAAVMVAGGVTWASASHPAPESWAFVARGDNPVDALSSGSLAGTLNAPVILTERDQLTDDAEDALVDVDPDTW